MKLLTISLISIMSCFLLASDNTQTLKKRIENTGEKELEVRISFAAGHLLLGKSNDDYLFDGVLDYRNIEPTISYRQSGEDGLLKIEVGENVDGDEHVGITLNSIDDFKDNEWDLRFSPDVRHYFDIEMGASKANLDFGGLQVRELNVESGVTDAVLDFSAPNKIRMKSFKISAGVSQFRGQNLLNANFDRFVFDGGVGDYELYFEGDMSQDVNVDLEVGMGSLTVYIPEQIAFIIECDASLFTSIDVESAYKKDDTYYSENYKHRNKLIRFTVDAGIGSVDFRTIR